MLYFFGCNTGNIAAFQNPTHFSIRPVQYSGSNCTEVINNFFVGSKLGSAMQKKTTAFLQKTLHFTFKAVFVLYIFPEFSPVNIY